jgi:capsular exopolysaccharide synthesis family protein
MPNNNPFQLADSSGKPQHDEIVDLKKIFKMIASKWYYFTITLIIALICALLYIRYSNPIYRVSATLLIDEEKKGISAENNQILQGFGLGPSAQNLDNQIMVLSSKTLIGRTLDELPFYTEYYYRKLNYKVTLYPESPIKIIPEISDSLPRNIEFTCELLGNNMFKLAAESNELFNLSTTASFGEIINTPGGKFIIVLSDTIWPLKNNNDEIRFIFHDKRNLIESYKNRMSVDRISRTGTIVELSLEGTNRIMEIEFLNKLCEIFLYNSLEKKNEEAVRTIQFIDDQLIGISDSLVITENKLQQFRSTHKVMDLSAQGQVIIDQAMSLENQKARLAVEANYYNYLADYLAKDNVGQAPIAPATMGITDPGLTKLVTDLADLQGQFYSKSLGEKNPLQSQLAQRLRNTKEALRETLNGVIRSNNMAMSEITEQIRTVNAQASALPVTERQLLGIERKYKINDELYTFLLEKRAGAQIQKASNLPDNEVIDPSEADMVPVKPRKQLIYLFAIVAGLGIPFLWILLTESNDNKVREDNDIKTITDLPVIGHIPHSDSKKNTLVLEESDYHTVEAFRSLRSRMQHLTRDTKSPVILITSSMPEEGKTFTAVNLAFAYSLMGKKTVLVGFDLRKPKIYTDFGLGNEKGISTWFMGKNSLEDNIMKTPHSNLFILPAGPVQPNPSDLASLEKTNELLNLLKGQFECIIIDSSPFGTISDAFYLATLADTCILIVRQSLTQKDILEDTINELKSSDIKRLSLLVNDLGPDYKHYRYAGFNRYTRS